MLFQKREYMMNVISEMRVHDECYFRMRAHDECYFRNESHDECYFRNEST